MTQFLDTHLDKSLGSTATWTDIDLSSNIPAGATGAIFQIRNLNASNQYNFGLRKKGSTDEFYYAIRPTSHTFYTIGVDTNRKCQGKIENTAVDFILIGYTESDAVFFTNAYAKWINGEGEWLDVDLSSELPAGAVAAIFEILNEHGFPLMWGLRKNGSTDDRYYDCGGLHHVCSIMGVDGDRKVEGKMESKEMRFNLLGYLIGGAANTNAIDNSLSTTGSYIDITETNAPAGATGVYVEMITPLLPYNFGVRKNGASNNVYARPTLKKHLVTVGLDTNKKWEGKIENVVHDFFTVGYFVGGGGNPTAYGTIIG